MNKSSLILTLAVATVAGLSNASKPAPDALDAPVQSYQPRDPLLTRLREMPPEHFADLNSMESWAGRSTEGGGSVKVMPTEGSLEAGIVFRSHTSRLLSSDIVLYSRTESSQPWRLVTFRQPLFADLIEVVSEDGRFRFQTVAGKRTVLEIPFEGLTQVSNRANLRELELLSFLPVEAKIP